MRLHFIIHAPFEMPGSILTWATAQNHDIEFTHTYRGEQLPHVQEIDFLIVMGGPQSPLNISDAPYLQDEIIFVKEFIKLDRPLLGFCLGAQIIAESLGAKTERSPYKEIGMFPIQFTETALADKCFSAFPSELAVMHWHNDMPGLPNGATILAASAGCPRQILRFKGKVYGFQCHPEMTADSISGMVKHCAEDITADKFVQDAQTLLNHDTKTMNNLLNKFLDNLIS